MVEVDKTGGRDLTSTPGNYIPGTGDKETDEDMAETVIITPPTGTNTAMIIGITTGIIALILVAVGIVVIKKKGLGGRSLKSLKAGIKGRTFKIIKR